MDEQRQDNQQEPIFNSSVPIQGVALKTYRERWMIEMSGERGSGRSMLALGRDDDYHHYYYYHFLIFFLLLFYFSCVIII